MEKRVVQLCAGLPKRDVGAFATAAIFDIGEYPGPINAAYPCGIRVKFGSAKDTTVGKT